MNSSTVSQLLSEPTHVWTRQEFLHRACPVPSTAGIYAWYFKSLEELVPYGTHHLSNGAALLYVGIAPFRSESRNDLRKRIRSHLKGNASDSTLRMTLGCLLTPQLGLTLQKTGRTDRLTFGDGERILDQWLDANAYFACHAFPNPWSIELEVIQALKPPLNLQHNGSHPFFQCLYSARARCREAAKGPMQPNRNRGGPQLVALAQLALTTGDPLMTTPQPFRAGLSDVTLKLADRGRGKPKAEHTVNPQPTLDLKKRVVRGAGGRMDYLSGGRWEIGGPNGRTKIYQSRQLAALSVGELCKEVGIEVARDW